MYAYQSCWSQEREKFNLLDKPITEKIVRNRKSFLKFWFRVLCVYSVLLEINKDSGELPVFWFHFSKVVASNGVDRLSTRRGLHGLLRREEYGTLDKVLLIVAKCINRTSRHKYADVLTNVRTHHRGSSCEVTRKDEKRAKTEKVQKMLDESVMAFKRLLANNFHEYCGLDLYTL